MTRTKDSEPAKVPSQRRQTGGARHEASERVAIRSGVFETSGWTLNVSRGGVRAVIEDPLDAEGEYEVAVGGGSARRARVAWARAEADGQIVGLKFLDGEGSLPPEDSH